MIPSLLVEIPHHQCVIWPHRDDLDGYHIKIPNLNDVTGQLALGNAYKNTTSQARRHQSSTSFLHTYRIIPGNAHEAPCTPELRKFSPADFKMKLSIFTLTLVGAVLASPQEKPPPAEERAASPQDKPQPPADRQGE